ncbi:NAD-dependent succinate-semialdehyde dehydrogenase [Mesorhizobium sp. WSM3879]|uniref:NAD-dependent succinate-semialdehyde dehydrogenase n=1 Tax=unclassified Mesorhizobium TaxID=325217 RepID=UPI000BAF8853|nr:MULTISPECIES: NAD-dependent succinate-semialdehyde dehydrogenase [unclassified Mesorhizobium]PBB79607.1 NAD-dependent succinate-semialdehyde dehydrogenase [Mesorhizobium sp. WSM3879]TIV01816.1 MAG: NAD-dependent succinate-semialdehyde dehydrogenase [Mesorhizobium sp.]PBB31209.1 NAD-dependent succinate-semialdehyde dehydrogenase [Mesorhizobium sp. WSM3868]PBB91614.1 NAD-dependent succinate-semialdehyde dehydrogenase [Mesorhizobium sp. WSM3864]RUW49349.1 NAD-dependent succinate-semialdehyde d
MGVSQTARDIESFCADAAAIIASAPVDLLVGGKWTSATGGNRFDVADPSNGLTIASVADGAVADAIRAIDAAEASATMWRQTPSRRRSDMLMRCHRLMLDRAEWLAQLISLENGKALPDARAEVTYAAEFFRWYAEEGVRTLGDIGHAPGGANRIVVQYQPIGIAVLVTPWNFPAAMATRKIAPALAAGCTCVLKPAAETPLTALAIGAILMEAGLPEGAVNIVTTTAAGPVVSAMLHDSRVRKLSFTGSTAVGRILLREAANRVISCSMELGGNAPFIVFDDADLDDAVAGAMVAKMRNGGEACTAANRFYVQRGIYDAFVRRLTQEMSSLSVGPGLQATTQLGPLITATAVEKVDRLLKDAVARGARIETGGKPRPGEGFFYPPTVLADVSPDSDIAKEEIFGPVAAVTPFDTEDEAVRLANDTEYGLISYVYSSDLRRALRVAERIESGMVGVNRGLVSDPAAPFGGMKQSGLGREGGHHGLLEYLQPKYIATNW